MQQILTDTAYPTARVQELEDLQENTTPFKAMVRNVTSQFSKAVALAPNVSKEAANALLSFPEKGQQADFIAAQLNLSFEELNFMLGQATAKVLHACGSKVVWQFVWLSKLPAFL